MCFLIFTVRIYHAIMSRDKIFPYSGQFKKFQDQLMTLHSPLLCRADWEGVRCQMERGRRQSKQYADIWQELTEALISEIIQTDRQTDRQADRQTDRQTDRISACLFRIRFCMRQIAQCGNFLLNSGDSGPAECSRNFCHQGKIPEGMHPPAYPVYDSIRQREDPWSGRLEDE